MEKRHRTDADFNEKWRQLDDLVIQPKAKREELRSQGKPLFTDSQEKRIEERVGDLFLLNLEHEEKKSKSSSSSN